jgi:curved DNA-binding protein CbpA
MSDKTHYTVLGISETATQEEIDREYRKFVEAYHVLSDSSQRSSYDQRLAQHRQQNAPARTTPLTTATNALLSVDVFSRQMGLSIDETKDLLAGKLPMTRALARKIQEVPGGSVEFWMSHDFGEEARGVNPWFAMLAFIFLIGLGYTVFVIVASVL